MSVADIRMSVRVRPTPLGDPCAVNLDPRTGALALTTGDVFNYASSVVVGSDQDVAYDALCAPLIRHALTGYDCTLVAYGQTGSGKTHTMFGPPGCLVEARVRQWRGESGGKSTDAPRDWGLFPRAVLELMRTPGVRSIRASAVEVYHENVFDLMNAREQLSVGSSKTKFGRRVEGSTESGSDDVAARGGQGGVHPSCCTCHKCFQLQRKAKERVRAERALTASSRSSSRAVSGGTKASSSSTQQTNETFSTVGETPVLLDAPQTRETFSAVGETLVPLDTPESLAQFARSIEATRTSKSHLLNDRSSRSHCLVKVRAKKADGTRVCIMFVDLAGSERVARTGATGDAKLEAQAINGSLSALGRVVKMLGEQSRALHGHVPYRDASLTMLLRDSFGGGSCTSVVINVAGETEHVDETACSLRFGERMSVVRNEPTRVLGDADTRSSRDLGGVASPGTNAVFDVSRAAELYRRLTVARGELNALELVGDGGGFVKGGPMTEMQSLRRGMEKLEAVDAASTKLRVSLAEALGEQAPSAVNIAHLRTALATSVKQADVLRSVVGRQKTIRAIWAEPTVSYARKAAEVRQIGSELEMEES
jgi:hypothetical protein